MKISEKIDTFQTEVSLAKMSPPVLIDLPKPRQDRHISPM